MGFNGCKHHLPIHSYMIEIKYIVDRSNYRCKLGSSKLIKCFRFLALEMGRDGQRKYLECELKKSNIAHIDHMSSHLIDKKISISMFCSSTLSTLTRK